MENFAKFVLSNHVLVRCVGGEGSEGSAYDEHLKDFAGISVEYFDDMNYDGKIVYIYGNLSLVNWMLFQRSTKVNLIEPSFIPECKVVQMETVELGAVPLVVGGGHGLYYPKFFDGDGFREIFTSHCFQSLTESNKGGNALRSGAYLTEVGELEDGSIGFNLLRCSTNLTGPTLNFSEVDWEIIRNLNNAARSVFDKPAVLNHVLAQVYYNSVKPNNKEAKATIRSHADKTKDMPRNGVMAFCTFYDNVDHLSPMEGSMFDLGVGKTSALTKLKFTLKDGHPSSDDFPETFTIRLYPNSVLFIPLTTNVYYQHEIKSPALNAAQIPTRIGYVVRCSKTQAVFKDGETYLVNGDDLVKLREPTQEDRDEIKRLYRDENVTTKVMEYGFVDYSLNKGDFKKPTLYEPTREFLQVKLSIPDTKYTFDNLLQGVDLFKICKGRSGIPLVVENTLGVSLVRTTTNYGKPSVKFTKIHEDLATTIENACDMKMKFNNACIEVYDAGYRKMSFHSDQAQDLHGMSYIALYSCYRDPSTAKSMPSRNLVVQAKDSDEQFVIPLRHNTVILFSLATNKVYKHKIVLNPDAPENEWLGVTFRTSKTFVKDGVLGNGQPLTLATQEERFELLSHRFLENNNFHSNYPVLSYTLSEGDLL